MARVKLVFLATTLTIVLNWETCSGSTIYLETFEDESADGITTTFGSWSISSGLGGSSFGYSTPGGTDSHVIRLDGVPSDNVRIEADFVIGNSSNGDFEVWLNGIWDNTLNLSPSRGYQVKLHPQGSDTSTAEIRKVPVVEFLDSKPDVINAGVEYHVDVRRFGGKIRVFLNDDLFLAGVDSEWSGGSVGFRFFNQGTIDNIRVSNYIPEPSTLSLVLLILLGLAVRRLKR